MATFLRQATVEWYGDVMRGSGSVSRATSSFSIPATYPRIAGDPPGHTAPEGMLAASHAMRSTATRGMWHLRERKCRHHTHRLE